MNQPIITQVTTEHLDLLSAIGSSEPSTFHEFCQGLKRTPSGLPTGTDAWRECFAGIEWLAHLGLVTIKKANGKIDTLQLTPTGADTVRKHLDANKPLFQALPDDEDNDDVEDAEIY